LRWFFKRALRDFLPQPILRKKKHGFGLPFGIWLVRHDELRSFARSSVEAFIARGVVAPRVATDLFERWLPTGPRFYGELVWILMMLEQWWRAHERAPAVEPPARFVLDPRA
jgi:asparagine synthase (glutamine-hydrolysing)